MHNGAWGGLSASMALVRPAPFVALPQLRLLLFPSCQGESQSMPFERHREQSSLDKLDFESGVKQAGGRPGIFGIGENAVAPGNENVSAA